MFSYYKRMPGFAKVTLLCFFALLLPINSYAIDVNFKWAANPEPVTGYKLYYKLGTSNQPPFDGTGLSAGDSGISLGKTTTYTVKGLASDKTYHFAVTAYNAEGESSYSQIVTVAPGSHLSPIILDMTIK